jgi:uncharacterized protein YndB with AHSA1/START domain
MTLLTIILIIVAVPFIIALFIPKKYTVERSIVINKPVHTVFDYVKLVNNQEYYNKWVMTDPNKTIVNTGMDGTVGFLQSWNGNSKAGEGEQEITTITQNERINIEIRFVRPFKSTAHIYIITQPVTEHSTKITWGMNGHGNYPLNLLTAFMKGPLGNDINTSLNSLKRNLES